MKNKSFLTLTVLLAIIFPHIITTTAFSAEYWSRVYDYEGSVTSDSVGSVRQTADGGFIVAGKEGNAFIIFKIKPDGTIDWQKNYGGYTESGSRAIRMTIDGGYIVTGDIDMGLQARFDFLVLKLKPDGTVGTVGTKGWQKTYGRDYYCEFPYSIQQTSGGGYIVAGEAQYTPSSGEVCSGEQNSDAWILKLNADGTIAWQKTYGGDPGAQVMSIQQTTDGGYIAAGSRQIFSGGSWEWEMWILKLDLLFTHNFVLDNPFYV